MVDHVPLLDLCYEEDVNAQVDMNLVMTAQGQFVELQGSGEEATFDEAQLQEMLRLDRIGVESLFAHQRLALAEPTGSPA
jgi:ribonuclease PH